MNREVSLGASIVNIGSDFSLALSTQPGTKNISLPVTYRVGASYQKSKYRGVADVVILDDVTHLHLGAEHWLHRQVALRAGYMFNYDTKNFTAGASFTRRKVTVEYAFVPYTDNLGTKA